MIARYRVSALRAANSSNSLDPAEASDLAHPCLPLIPPVAGAVLFFVPRQLFSVLTVSRGRPYRGQMIYSTLVVHVRQRVTGGLSTGASLYTLLQILSVTLFEKMPVQ